MRYDKREYIIETKDERRQTIDKKIKREAIREQIREEQRRGEEMSNDRMGEGRGKREEVRDKR